jgi:protein-S-isoprenylcysteine O-methyltransferase Ste14
MFTGFSQSLLVFVFIASFYVMDSLYIHKFDTQRKAEGSGRSCSYTLLVLSMAAVLVLQPVLLPQIGLMIHNAFGMMLQVIGVIAIASAFSLHILARKHLRQFYAERVEIQPGHQLVNTGPYAYIRHPVITSFFLFAAGLVLINLSLTTLFVLFFTLWDFSRAARQEEELLSRSLPGYVQYMNRTGAFIPRFPKSVGGTRFEH